jgi:hypothetical protein
MLTSYPTPSNFRNADRSPTAAIINRIWKLLELQKKKFIFRQLGFFLFVESPGRWIQYKLLSMPADGAFCFKISLIRMNRSRLRRRPVPKA